MAQPKNPPLSVRLPADLLAEIDAEGQPGEARNAVIVRLLRERIETGAPEEYSGHKTASPIELRQLQRLRNAAVSAMVQLGPEPSSPGSRLKKGK